MDFRSGLEVRGTDTGESDGDTEEKWVGLMEGMQGETASSDGHFSSSMET